MNIAIFGGSFDPPHIAHEKIAKKVAKQTYIDKVIVVPTYLNPFKKTYHFKPKARLKLLKKLFKSKKKIAICDYEIGQNRAVPSIETVEFLQKIYQPKKIYLVIGADNLASLPTWDNFEKLKSLVEFLVVSREGYEAKNDIIPFKKLKMDIDISSSSLREKIDFRYIPKKIKKKVKRLWKKE